MTKKQYLDEQIAVRLQYWIGKMLLLGIIFFPFIGVADYFATPDNLKLFTGYRLGISCLLLVVYFLNKRKRGVHYQHTLISAATILSAFVIEIMILRFGGHASSYYAGLNLLIIAALGLIPYGFFLSLSLSIVIYLIYIVPIFIFDTITNPSAFVANNVFIICTFVLVLTWRILSQKIMMNELSHQYDLVQDKQKLEEYAKQLETLLKELNKSEQWHRSLFENATDGIIVLDRNGIIVNANEQACAMHGFSRDVMLRTHIKLFERDGQGLTATERIGRILAGEALVFETIHSRKDGTPIHLEVSAKTIEIEDELYIQSFYRDITEKRKLREHLAQSQKMESIGVLAGGIAHDFNNILTAILGHTEVVRFAASLDSKALRSLQVIEDISLKAGGMISKLLGFARKTSYEMRPLNLNDVVYDTVKLLERVIDRKISVKVELDSDLPVIRGDFNQLEQVVMNLIVNARDAMPQGGGIVIATRQLTVGDAVASDPPFAAPGSYVLLSVTDTGVGIPDSVMGKIFEPFFTTKERGKGTGLGLSMVYGAVKEHRGHITARSRTGAGSEFTIYLPVSDLAEAANMAPVEPMPCGNETLLIVDDQEEVLSAARETLVKHGYRVLASGDPENALRLYRQSDDEIALVITDMVMPGMDGKELIKRLRAINPRLKILAMSGFLKYVAEKEDIREIAGFLQKPFETRALLTTIRRILDTRQDAHEPMMHT